MSLNVPETSFPAAGLLPKSETGVSSFLQKYPQYDGRDVTIAIFDSGVDPRATGLQTLCDGRTVKVIERFDCSGCGDVDMSKKVIADENGYITGLSGRRLKLTPEMIASNTAKNEYRIGLKTFIDLCPTKVRESLVNKTKIKEWDGPHKTAIAEVSRKLNEFEAKNSDTSTKLSWDKKLVKENLENTLEMLNNYDKTYADIKTTFDCILYPIENGWQAVIDTTEKGDLENAVFIGEYSKTYETKNVDEYLSVSINVHDDGEVLEIVGICSPHGTHVSSIASGFNCAKDVNGVAPNAKIVSLTIGEGRLGSMETGAALVRAMMKVMEMCRDGRKIDVINMSYGEHSNWSNSGNAEERRKRLKSYVSRIGELMCEVVNKYGVVWVASAGNHGPALCTVGTPPDICQTSCIGVGAYVSPQMMEAEYAMRERLPGNVYTWTSRDPCIDGGRGVTICAPGGAIASVPQFTMTKATLMNGTSMAAPHVAGAIALIISGLKQRGIEYSPFSIKRALSVTGTKLDFVDPFAQGHGLLNVEKAFEHLVEHKTAVENMLRFTVRCGSINSKGIHLRSGVLKKPVEYSVSIDPAFLNERETEAKHKYNFNLRLNLVPTQSFVSCGAFLDCSYGGRNIAVKVDPTNLQPGVHSAAIRAFDSDCVEKGPIFEIPITVVQPHVINCEESRTFEPLGNLPDGSFEFQPHTIRRDFILVPNKATWAVLRIRSTDKNREKEIGKFYVHTMQILPKSSCRTLETQKMISVNSTNDTTLTFRCQEHNILELCIAKYWSNYGNTHVKYSLTFHGIQITNPHWCVMNASRGVHKFQISSLSNEEIQPQIQFKAAAVVLKPTETKISPLSATRDVIPEGRQIYQNLFTYSLHLAKPSEVAIYSPILNPLLYEAEFESQFWMMFDSNKSMIACGDSHSCKFFTKLEKGDYTIRMQVRHEKRELLEKISEIQMLAVFKLSNVICLDLFDHYNRAVVNGAKFSMCTLKDEEPKILYATAFTQDKLSKANLPNNAAWLSGTATFAKDESGRRVDLHDFIYMLTHFDAKKNGHNGTTAQNNNSAASVATTTTITAASNTPKTNQATPSVTGTAGPVGSTVTIPAGDGNAIGSSVSGNTSPRTKPISDEYADGLRDFQCSMITKSELEKAELIFKEVILSHPNYFTAYLNLVQNIETNALKTQPMYPLTFSKSIPFAENRTECENGDKLSLTLERIAQLTETVIKETDKDALLSYYGLKCDTRSDAAKIKTNMDKQRNNLLEALVKRGVAIAKTFIINNSVKENLSELDDIYLDIIKFVDISDSKVLQFALWHAYANEHYGRMYKFLMKMYEDKRNREILEELKNLAEKLQYNHVAKAIDRLIVTSYPVSYRPF